MNFSSDSSGQQIPLQFHQYQALSFDEFLPGNNEEALHHVQSLALGDEYKALYLWGASGTGKSHLLQAACKLASEQQRTVAYIPAELIRDNGPEILEGLEQLQLICIDDVHLAGLNPKWQEALLHLYNRIHDEKHQLIMSSRDNPMSIDIELADLKSRLSWGLIYRLESLSDDEKTLLLQQRAKQRGFELPDEVCDYLFNRVERNLENLLNLLDRIDHQSLSEQRRITIPFVKTLIG